MKICLISFDFWHYDEHIVNKLKEKGIEAYHINIGAFTHKNFGARVKNTFSKVFLGKNLKHGKRQNFIIESLHKIGKQDQILVINPEAIEERVHREIRKYATRNIAYLYDSMSRNPAEHILHFFDTVFSFDDEDVANFGFNKITNYNYLQYCPAKQQNPKIDLFYITSYDTQRLMRLNLLVNKISNLNICFKTIVAGKKAGKRKLPRLLIKKILTLLSLEPKIFLNNLYLNSIKTQKLFLTFNEIIKWA